MYQVDTLRQNNMIRFSPISKAVMQPGHQSCTVPLMHLDRTLLGVSFGWSLIVEWRAASLLKASRILQAASQSCAIAVLMANCATALGALNTTFGFQAYLVKADFDAMASGSEAKSRVARRVA